MALVTIEKFTETTKENKVHEETTAEYSFFYKNGVPYFQIDTYGSTMRENPTKVSQSIQMNKDMAQHLINILRSKFELN